MSSSELPESADDEYIKDWRDFLDKSKRYHYERWNKKLESNVSLSDFVQLRTIGTGAFGRVILSKLKEPVQFYAIKIVDKSLLKDRWLIDHALSEKKILQSIRLPFAVHLEFFFQDNSYLYYVLPFVSGGEMFTHLRKMGKFDDNQVKFYGAQLVLSLEYLHFLDLVYRDFKPENILLEADGYLKLSDFGICKYVPDRTYTLCGTPDYIAPEVINNQGYGKSVDFWGLGVLIYEMSAGYPPFQAKDNMKIYKKAQAGKYRNAPHFNNDLKDIIKEFLQPNPDKRLGVKKKGIEDIKDHKYFSSIPWLGLVNKNVEPPYTPKLQAPGDTTNFDHYNEVKFVVARTNKFGDDFIDF